MGAVTRAVVGRNGLLTRCQLALGRGPVVIRGVPGIGKSAVVEVLLADRPGSLVLRGVAVLASVPYLPVRVARPDLAIDGGPGAVAARLVADLPDETALAVEDLHWCDVDTLEVVERAAYLHPVLVTTREIGGAAQELVAALAGLGEVIDLGPLENPDAAELVRALRPGATAADVARCVAAGHGIPLDLQLAAFGDDGAPDAADRASLAVAALDPEVLEVLAALAVAGTEVPAARPHKSALAELQRHGLAIEPAPGRWMPRHDRIAAAAMATLPPARLRALHLAEAEVSADPAVRAIHLAAAGQLPAAASAAAIAARRAPTISSRAEYLRIQAECTKPPSAAVGTAAAEALSLSGRYAEALAVLDRDPAVGGLRGAVVRARAHWATTDIPAARRAVEDGLAVPGAEPDLTAELLGIRSRIECRVDWDLERAAATAREGIDLAPGPGRGLMACRSALGLVQLMGGDPAWATELAAAGRLAVAAEDLHNAVIVYDTLFFGHLLSGDPAQCPAIADEAVAATEQTSPAWNGYFRAVALLAKAHVHADHQAVLAEGALLARRTLTVKATESARTARVFALADAGRELDAVELAEHAIEHASDDSARAVASWSLAESAWLAGEHRRSVSAATTSLTLPMAGFPGAVNAALMGLWAATELGERGDERLAPATESGFVNLRGASLEAAALQARPHDPGRAADEFESAAAAWGEANVRAFLRCCWAAADAALAHGDLVRAEGWLRSVEEHADRLGIVWLQRRVSALVRRAALGRRPDGPPPPPTAAEVLARVARGQSSAAISRSLRVSVPTVESHLRTAMRRTGARTRLQAAALVAAVPARPDLEARVDGRGVVRVRTVNDVDGPARRIDELPAAPWRLRDPVVIVGPITNPEELAAAVVAVARGAHLDVEIAADERPAVASLLDGLRQVGRLVHETPEREPTFSPEDEQIISLLAAGASVTEVSGILGYSRRTVQRRLADLRSAVGATTNSETIVRASARLGALAHRGGAGSGAAGPVEDRIRDDGQAADTPR
ncbi:MAG: transcriptional regulator, LuxR family [Acidimicrobiales bacterium]|nr:transcriptional regulator, LuxR family [Acidimicrobiales bacterium]